MAMPLTRARLLAALFATSATLLAGCNAESGILRSAGGPETPVIVWVRDRATRSPIVGAAIAAETTSRHHPFSAASILGQTDTESSRTTTDEHGAATIQLLDGREFRLVVWAPGRSPVVFGPAMISRAAGAWIDPELPPGGADPGVQARLGDSPEEPAR